MYESEYRRKMASGVVLSHALARVSISRGVRSAPQDYRLVVERLAEKQCWPAGVFQNRG